MWKGIDVGIGIAIGGALGVSLIIIVLYTIYEMWIKKNKDTIREDNMQKIEVVSMDGSILKFKFAAYEVDPLGVVTFFDNDGSKVGTIDLNLVDKYRVIGGESDKS